MSVGGILRKAKKDGGVSYREAKELFSARKEMEILEAAREVALEHQGREIALYRNAFPPVSITGTKCELNCRHCGGHYLKHMLPATSERKLVEVCRKLNKKGVPGIVLSGGSRRDGTVPLEEFAGAIKTVKEETELAIIAHTGPIDSRQTAILGRAGIDGALLDVVGSSQTTEEVYGVRIPPWRYAQAIRAIDESSIKNLSPHIIVGLHFGKILGEIKALSLLSNAHIDNIVIIVIIPTEGTMMSSFEPPSPRIIGKIISIAKLMYPETPVALGCVRPGEGYRRGIDEAAIRAGATKLAIPSSSARVIARELELGVREFEQMCCAWM